MIFSTSKKKKGQINDAVAIIVIPFALAFILISMNLVFDEINTSWQNSTTYSQTSKDVVSDAESKFVPVFDYGFLLIFLGLIIAGIVGLFLLDTHPIIFTASTIGFFALFVVSAFLANAFSDSTEIGSLSTYTNEFTFIPLIMENLLPTTIIVTAILSIAFFAKIRNR